MPTEKIPTPTALGPALETKRRPIAITIAFLLVLMASFLPWGTIRHNYTWKFMAYMDHPSLSNRIAAQNRPGAVLPLTGTAWTSGFDILGFYLPHWILTAIAVMFFACAIAAFLDFFLINPGIPLTLAYAGLIHVVASAWGFSSQGSIGWGLVLTGLGYLIFIVSFLQWK